LTHNPTFKGLNPAFGTAREKMAKKVFSTCPRFGLMLVSF
jgi:hypothetical protein